ncbi:MAG: hypothetical protein ACRDN0_02535, partial [Trebonia sp.]
HLRGEREPGGVAAGDPDVPGVAAPGPAHRSSSSALPGERTPTRSRRAKPSEPGRGASARR